METLPLLIAFFEQIDVLLLILVRVTAFFVFVPIFSGMSIPMEFRLFLSFALSIALFTSGLVTQVTYHDSMAGLFVLILIEFMAGALMGFVLFFIFNLFLFAGHFMDFSMGFAMVNVMDPVQQIQVPVLGNIMFMTMNAFLIVTGGLNILLLTFFNSYRLVPMGSAVIIANAPLAEFMVVSLVGFTMLAVQIALPIVGTMLIIDVCLGIMVKAVPQMNVFVVGMPLKVFVGFFLLYVVMVPSFPFIYELVFERAFDLLEQVIWRMSPDGVEFHQQNFNTP